MGTLRGTIAHSSECAAMNARSYATLKARQCNGLQSDDDESSTVAIKWRESCFKSLLLVSTILREMVGELFPSDSSARRIKGEIGSSFQVIGELIGDMGGHSAEEMEHLEEALKLKTEACGDDQNNESIADTLVSGSFLSIFVAASSVSPLHSLSLVCYGLSSSKTLELYLRSEMLRECAAYL